MNDVGLRLEVKREALDQYMRSAALCLWYRHLWLARRIINKYMLEVHSLAWTDDTYRWHRKAKKLIDWLYLPENRELGRHTPPFSRNTREYYNWKIDCLNRDNWKCQTCGIGKKLHIHHIKPYKDYKELRTNIDNGITLCKHCHKNNS